ncbi:MAG: glycosyltransferase family 4 protein [Campylobacter sp.]|nr:glycosyltransferase family 4 protein [Campylobacter sp.]
MSKIKVIFDVTIIAIASGGGRSGIFSVARSLFESFRMNNQVSLSLYCEGADKQESKKALEKQDIDLKDMEFFFVQNNAETKTMIYSLKQIIKRFISILPKPFGSVITKFAKKILQKPSKKVIFEAQESYDVFFSPCFKIKNNLAKQNYILLHDVIPLIFLEYKNNPGNYWFLELTRKLDEGYTCFANSAYTKADFLKHLPHLKPENIIVNPLACDERFKPANADEIAKAKAKYKIPSDKKYIFSLCTLEPRKNLIRAVKCFANFISKNNIDDLVFVLGGAQWDRFISILENEIGSLDENIKSRILKIGYVDDSDQAALYSGALFFVYTSQYEGFGLPPLEAMSCGTPVITSNNSSLPEVVGNAGIMIDYDDDAAHIKAYESYYYNENLRQENSKKGLERAKLFSWEKCADIMITEMKRRAGL